MIRNNDNQILQKQKNLLKWQPEVDLEVGLSKTIEWVSSEL